MFGETAMMMNEQFEDGKDDVASASENKLREAANKGNTGEDGMRRHTAKFWSSFQFSGTRRKKRAQGQAAKRESLYTCQRTHNEVQSSLLNNDLFT